MKKGYKLFGERLRKYAKDNGLTQEQLAEKLDIDPRHISRWINGAQLPNVSSLLRICQVTGLSADYLIGRIDHEDTGD